MIKVIFKYQLFILFVFVFVNLYSQQEILTIGIKETVHLGAILPHRQEVNEIVEGHTQAYELSFYKATVGKKKWQQAYHYPQVGISVLAINLGNPKELGMGYGLFPFVELPLSSKNNNLRLKMGYGFGYIEKPFDAATNFKNIAIGSHINAIIHANLLWSFKLSNGLSSSLGVSILHFSNGSFSRPNLGINIVSLNAGIFYHFGAKKTLLVNEFEPSIHQWNKVAIVGFGIKEVPPPGGVKYVVSSYSFNMMKTRAEKSSFGFGADLFYNTSLSHLIAVDTSASNGSLDNFRLGIVGIYSFDFDRISLLVEMGGYVFSNYKHNGAIYHRITSRFYLNKKLFLNLGIKTHFMVADFVEFGIGYKFIK